MDWVYVIRHKGHHEGRSIQQIARDLGVSRNTVRKYVGDSEEPDRRRAPRPRPVLKTPQHNQVPLNSARCSAGLPQKTARYHGHLLQSGLQQVAQGSNGVFG